MPSPFPKIALRAAALGATLAVAASATLAAALGATLAVAVTLGPRLSWAVPVGRGYRNDAFRVRSFEPPATWQAAPQPSYPRLLVEYTHPDGGRLTLAAQKVVPGSSAETLAKNARASLEKQGFANLKLTPDGARTRLDASLDGGRRFLKQLYVVDGGLGYVVSLVAGTVNQPEMARDFEQAAHSLEIVSADGDGGAAR